MDAVKNREKTENKRSGEALPLVHRFTPSPIPRLARSIKVQLIAGITIVTVVAIALIGFLSIRMLEWNALFRKSKEAAVIVAAVQTHLQEKSDKETGESLKRFIARISKENIIRDMTVVDEENKVIFAVGEGLSPKRGVGRKLFFITDFDMEMIGGGWFEGIGKELVVSAPLRRGFVQHGTNGPGIFFSIPLSDVREEGANFRKFILFYAVFDSLIIIIAGAYVFFKGIIRPMAILKNTAESISGGRLDQRVSIKAPQEIDSFAASFNIMADRLEEKIKTLERVNRELVIAQEELVRSEKLATIGRLAAGIAHEIGNPLGAMLGYVDILKKGVSKEEEMDILARLANEMTRIHTTVRGLLDFSRPSKGMPHYIDVNKVINDSASLLLPQFSVKAISLDMQLGEGLPPVLIDEGMLQQVLFNLFLNAKDVMEKGGILRVETTEFTAPEHIQRMKIRKDDAPGSDASLLRSALRERKYIKISVADTGKGISEDNISKIFDPFFTTKEKGTGLGLPVSLGIVQACGGDIKVKSELGKGTTFEVLLPVEQEKKRKIGNPSRPPL